MAYTIQQMREERGESRMQLAAALGVTLDEVTEWEFDRAEPTTAQLRMLAAHFGVTEREIDLNPPPFTHTP